MVKLVMSLSSLLSGLTQFRFNTQSSTTEMMGVLSLSDTVFITFLNKKKKKKRQLN